MKLEIDGVEYDNFTGASAEIRLDALTNTFSFETVTSDEEILPISGGESCRVLIDDISVMDGWVEVVSGSHDGNGHTISVQGRDNTADLLDSSISEMSDLKETITLKSIIEKVAANIGLQIDVIDEANPAPFNSAEDIEAPENGDNAFEFIESLARKRQTLLTSNSDSDIVISYSPAGDSGGYLQNIIGANDNNIVSASWSYDDTGRYNLYKFASVLNVSISGSEIKANADIVNQKGIFLDEQIRIGRQFALVAEAANSNDQNNSRAKWEAKIRRARGKVYSCKVQGYKPDPDGNFLWDVNELVHVVDEFARIDAIMLINSVSFGYDLNDGKTTVLSMVEQNSYNLQLEEPETDKVGGSDPF